MEDINKHAIASKPTKLLERIANLEYISPTIESIEFYNEQLRKQGKPSPYPDLPPKDFVCRRCPLSLWSSTGPRIKDASQKHIACFCPALHVETYSNSNPDDRHICDGPIIEAIKAQEKLESGKGEE